MSDSYEELERHDPRRVDVEHEAFVELAVLAARFGVAQRPAAAARTGVDSRSSDSVMGEHAGDRGPANRRAAGLREQIVATFKDFDLAQFDAIESYAYSLAFAHPAYLGAVQPADPLPELATRAMALRDQLLGDVNTLARRKLLDRKRPRRRRAVLLATAVGDECAPRADDPGGDSARASGWDAAVPEAAAE